MWTIWKHSIIFYPVTVEMTSKYNNIPHHYIYYQYIVLSGAFAGLCSLQYGHLDELLGYFVSGCFWNVSEIETYPIDSCT